MNFKITASTLALTAALLGKGVFAMELSDVRSQKSKKIVPLGIVKLGNESPLAKKYFPKTVNCGTYNDFINYGSIYLDGRTYQFCGGTTLSKLGGETPTNLASEVMATSQLDRPLPLVEVNVNLDINFLQMTYHYFNAALPGCSYKFTVGTFLEKEDIKDVLFAKFLNTYLPTEATRDAFKDLKEGEVSTIEGKRYGFFGGEARFHERTEVRKTPSELLPRNAWLNGWRKNHTLANIELAIRDRAAIVMITYMYEPAFWDVMGANKYVFTVGTPITQNEFFPIKIEQLTKDLYQDMYALYQAEFLSVEKYAEFCSWTYNLSVDLHKDILNNDAGLRDIRHEFEKVRNFLMWEISPIRQFLNGEIGFSSSLLAAHVPLCKTFIPTKELLAKVDKMASKLYDDIIRASQVVWFEDGEENLSSEDLVDLIFQTNDVRLFAKAGLIADSLTMKQIQSYFQECRSNFEESCKFVKFIRYPKKSI